MPLEDKYLCPQKHSTTHFFPTCVAGKGNNIAFDELESLHSAKHSTMVVVTHVCCNREDTPQEQKIYLLWVTLLIRGKNSFSIDYR
jgi:hypothetical protein